MERREGQYLISDDPALLDLDVVHGFLSRDAYWSRGVPREVVERSIAGSIPFGVYRDGAQVGFARVVTDAATFAWIADVFVLPEHRGKNLAFELVRTILGHPSLRGLRRIVLATMDAHGLYERLGFAPLRAPERWMGIEREAAEAYRSMPSEPFDG